MGILTLIIVGFVAGLIARALMPGRQHMGFLMTTLLGIVGSFVGGLIGYAIAGRNVGEFHPAGLILSIIGAFLVLAIVGMVGSHRRAVV
jgi:uncharacterized membrane protein YeaQ/YmgE (transglycosylase-associated protein family)